MVRLEKITMQGFKSFKRPVTMPFPTNFAVVTGPNGSGKSNLNDAISFVMAKGSSKQIRAKKAGDLVFHGSKKKGASEYAKVNLVFSNDGKRLPVDEDNVHVTRRLNKEGVSTYRLNGKVTTRQQIIDIFTQARLSPGGHNIMKQGDITRVVEMNAIERRGIIDEISGITEYDEKKLQAIRELEKVAEKVREAEIILDQKEQIVEKLKQDRDAALNYKHFIDELNSIKAAVIWKEYSSAEKHINVSDKEIETKEEEIERLGEELKGIDKEFTEKEKALDDIMKQVFKVSDQAKITEKLSKFQSSIESKENLIDSNERETKRLQRMIESMNMLERKVPPGLKEIMNFDGVHGFVSDLVTIPDKYRVAADVAGGSHMSDIVVDSVDVAAGCIKHLKENRIGRARFLPMDRIDASHKPPLPQGTYGWLSELVHHEPKYAGIMEFIFGRTAAVNDIDKAKEIAKKNRIRMVTLDGDLIEASGAMTGGFYMKSKLPPETKQYIQEKEKLQEQNELLEDEIASLTKQINEIKRTIKDSGGDENYEKRMRDIKANEDELREKRREVYDNRINLQNELNSIKINKAKYEANFDKLRIEWEEHSKTWENLEDKEEWEKRGLSTMKEREKEILTEINMMGPVNMKAIDEFDILKEEFDEYMERVSLVVTEKDKILESITEIEEKKRVMFEQTMMHMTKLFREIYSELTGGDAELGLEDPKDINSGLIISAQPPGKKLLYIDSMSGGEKVLTALAFLFTIQRHKPAPFYVMDEVDAALDKPNTKKVAKLVKKHSKDLQFIIISHNNEMINAADQVFGVSMEDGESKIIGIKLPEGKAKAG